MKATKMELKVTADMKEKILNAICVENHKELNAFYEEQKSQLGAVGAKMILDVTQACQPINSLSSLEEAIATVQVIMLFVEQLKKFTAVQYGMEVVNDEEYKAAGDMKTQILALFGEMEAEDTSGTVH